MTMLGKKGPPYPELSEAGPECIFLLPDTNSDVELSVECTVEQESGGISISVDGLQNGEGKPIFIEWRNHTLWVHVWTNKDEEDPTHTVKIPLD